MKGVKTEKPLFKKREEKILLTLCRFIMPGGGRFEKGAEDVEDLMERLSNLSRSLDPLTLKLLKFSIFHFNYMPVLNFLFVIAIAGATVSVLHIFSFHFYVWVIVLLIEMLFLYFLESVHMLRFGIVPFHMMDEEAGNSYLEHFSQSRILFKRLTFFSLKGLVCLALYSTESYETFIGYREHLLECLREVRGEISSL